MPNLRARLYAENVPRIEGSVALTVQPGLANFSYIFSQNLANNRNKTLAWLVGWSVWPAITGKEKMKGTNMGKRTAWSSSSPGKLFFIYYTDFDSPSWGWKERIRACTSSIFIGKTEMVISWLARGGQRFSCILLYTLDWAGRVTLSPEATFLHKKTEPKYLSIAVGSALRSKF